MTVTELRLAFDTISNSPVRLDGHTLNNGINRALLKSHAPLRALSSMVDIIIYLVAVRHFDLLPGTEFLEAETGQANSSIKRLSAHRDNIRKTSGLKSPRKNALFDRRRTRDFATDLTDTGR